MFRFAGDRLALAVVFTVLVALGALVALRFVVNELFTTKSCGSGLGLTFVRRVVEAHKGRLFIDSEEGAGTTVRIALPICV